jgi:hypothetical protein
MKVEISENGVKVWMRDSVTQEGVLSQEYLKDGTQQRIIAALEDALFQAKGQLLLSENVN